MNKAVFIEKNSIANYQMEAQLKESLTRLERTTEHIIKTNGYTAEAKKLRLLMELVKEQIKNENSVPATRTIR
ncbi:MAG: hypothetical protein ABL927_06680 [Bdellovibrionales bacterium]